MPKVERISQEALDFLERATTKKEKRTQSPTFISSEHAKERIGIHSPGPIYDVPSTFGSGPKKSFGSYERQATLTTNRFYSKPQTANDHTGSDSPGFVYNLRSTIGDGRKPSFGKAKRHLATVDEPQYPGALFDHEYVGTHSPGPKYVTPTSIGKQPDNRLSSPQFSFGKGERFKDEEFISREHEMASHVGREGPGPGAHDEVSEEVRKSRAPTFSFGTAERAVLSTDNRGPERVRFISGEHSQVDFLGVDSPGPVYNIHGTFDNISGSGRTKAPGYSFGMSDRVEDFYVIPVSPRSAAARSNTAVGKSLDSSLPPPPPRNVQSAPASGPTNSASASAIHQLAKSVDHLDVEGGGGAMVGFDEDVEEVIVVPARKGIETAPGAIRVTKRRTRFISKEHSATEHTGVDSPGPVHHPPSVQLSKSKAPSYSFGTSHEKERGRRFIGPAFDKEMLGFESPGPGVYNPDDKSVRPGVPEHSFGVYERSKLVTDSRFYGEDIARVDKLGFHSPGPAVHHTEKWSDIGSHPAYTMAGKEPPPVPKISPSPTRVRYVSAEASKENMGQFSPGPKYMIASSLGKAPAYSFGLSDREYLHSRKDCNETEPCEKCLKRKAIEKEKAETMMHQDKRLPSPDKPYLSPAESRYISQAFSDTMPGKYSPGPMLYDVNTMDMTKFSTHAKQPSWSISRTERPEEAVYMIKEKESKARIISAEHAESELLGTESPGPQYVPVTSQTTRRPPAFSFGTSERGKKAETSSPGPLYNPKFGTVESSIPNTKMGALQGMTTEEKIEERKKKEIEWARRKIAAAQNSQKS